MAGKSKLEKVSSDLKVTYGLLDFSQKMVTSCPPLPFSSFIMFLNVTLLIGLVVILCFLIFQT